MKRNQISNAICPKCKKPNVEHIKMKWKEGSIHKTYTCKCGNTWEIRE